MRMRKKYWIHPSFQLRFIGFSVINTIAILGIVFAANSYFFWQFNQQGIRNGLPAGHLFFQMIQKQNSQMNLIFAFVAVAVSLFLIVASTIFSHRVAGALYRIRQHLMVAAAGKKVEKLRFRKKDFFPELGHAVDDLLEKNNLIEKK